MRLFYYCFILITFKALALVQVDVQFTHKKGLLDQLILKSELHKSLYVYEYEKKSVFLKDGYHMEIYTALANTFADYGPVPVFKLRSKIFHDDNLLSESEKLVELGKKNIISFSSNEGEHIQVSVIPKIHSEKKIR